MVELFTILKNIDAEPFITKDGSKMRRFDYQSFTQ